MTYEPTTNFKDSNNVDLGKKLVTRDYLLEVYVPILESLGNSELTVSPALWTWGSGSFGKLGNNLGSGTRSTPITTFTGGTNWQQISFGFNNSAAIKTDGTLWVWGDNQGGSLGINNTLDRSIPVTTSLGGTNWKQVSCGVITTAGIKDDGTLWIWGENTTGELGNNNTIDRSTPVTTSLGGTNWREVSVYSHSMAIKTDGTLWVWGGNSSGRLGINNTISRSTPVTTFLGGNNWKSIAAKLGFHSAAIKTDGTLWLWGLNDRGALGINNTIDRSTPVTTSLGGTNWKQVSCGSRHTAAIKTDGTLWVWGNNSAGQLGINNTIDRSTPVTTFLGGTNWKRVSCGSVHTIAIKTDGTLWTWGNNSSGELGINDNLDRSTPVTTFLGGINWKLIYAGETHNGAIQSVDYI